MDYRHKYLKYKAKYLILKGGNIPKIIVTQHNKKDSFNNLLYILRKMDWFRKNNYHVPLPKNKHFIELAENPEKVRTIDWKKYFDIFVSEVYKPIPLDKVQNMINEKKEFFDSVFTKLNILKNN